VRIGIFGGTFDPVHRGHVRLAEMALRELRLDRIFFVPAGRSPLKSKAPVSEASHRLKMLRLAVKKMPRSRISLFELGRRGGPSYTIETVRHFRRRHPKSRLFLVMGSDSLESFRRWRDWRKILELCTLVVGKRKASRAIRAGKIREKALFLKSAMPDISSTEVRKAQKTGGKLDRFVPRPVMDYIRRQRVYGRAKSH
jgi:nicotinate-nucleotide adenylyltransferase